MKWQEATKKHPNKWLLIKVIKAKSQNGLRVVEDLDIIKAFESGSEALKDIMERTWMGVRKNMTITN